MARLNRVAKSQKDYRCVHGHLIPKGSSYLWFKKAYASKTVYCEDHRPPRSVYATSSPYIAAAWDIEDGFDFSGTTAEEAAEQLQEAASQIRDDISEPLRESAQAMEDGFGHATYQSDELIDRADNFEYWAEELERFGQDLESSDEPFDPDDLDIPGSPE